MGLSFQGKNKRFIFQLKDISSILPKMVNYGKK